MNYKPWIPFILLCVYLGSQCTQKNNPGEYSGDSKIVCVLLDLSYSTQQQEIRKTYAKNFGVIISALTHGDAIYAAMITEKSVYELDFCLKYEIPPIVFSTENRLYRKAELKRAEQRLSALKDSLCQVACSTLEKYDKKIMKTQIMGAMQVAERIFHRYHHPQKMLVIMSDMIEDSDHYNFYRENLHKSRIQEIISRERADNHLPNLQQVRVYVTGAMAEGSDRYYKIRDFWLEYCKACGAELRPEDYGAALIKFP